MLPDSVLRRTSILLTRFAAHVTDARDYSFSKSATASVMGRRPRFPIHVDGIHVATLELAFDEYPIPEKKPILLDQMAAAIEAVETLPQSTAIMTARAARHNVEFAEIEISERARGLLAQDVDPDQAVCAIVRRVEQVLERRHLSNLFAQLLPQLEERVAEPKLLVKAKSLLKDPHDMSEEQACLHLKNCSRSSHKRLRELAGETISQHRSTQKREGVGL